VKTSWTEQHATKLDKLPEYLRDTVDWFMGKTRGRRDRDATCEETKLYLQEPCLERKIPDPDLLSLTEFQEGLDINEWLASHTIGFFEHTNLVYGTVSEFCNLSTCPDMVVPGPRNHLWVDDKGKKSRVSAPQYVDYVMTFVQKTINDETIFPTKHGNEFPPMFDTVVKKIHKLLFHVIAHIYHSHFREVVLLGLHAHLNSLFAHIVEFSFKYHTIEEKETEVLQDLIVALRLVPDTRGQDRTNNEQEENKENIDENSQHTTPNGSLNRRGGSGPGAGGAPGSPSSLEGSAAVQEHVDMEVTDRDSPTPSQDGQSNENPGDSAGENCVDMSDTEANSCAMSASEECSN